MLALESAREKWVAVFTVEPHSFPSSCYGSAWSSYSQEGTTAVVSWLVSLLPSSFLHFTLPTECPCQCTISIVCLPCWKPPRSPDYLGARHSLIKLIFKGLFGWVPIAFPTLSHRRVHWGPSDHFMILSYPQTRAQACVPPGLFVSIMNSSFFAKTHLKCLPDSPGCPQPLL